LLLMLAGCGGRSVSHSQREEIRPKPEGCLLWQDEFLIMESGGTFVGVRPSEDFRRRVIGNPDCGGVVLNTLALSVWGDAYPADVTGQLFQVDEELHCEGVLGPVDSQETFGGMSFVGTEGDGEVIKFVERIDDQNVLGTIDPRVPSREVGPVLEAAPYRTELAGGLDGRLFALSAGSDETKRAFVEIDPTTAKAVAEFEIGLGVGWSLLAAVRLENFVYGFATDLDGLPSRVFELDVEHGSVRELPRFPSFVIGAGTSLCAARLGLEPPE
jgi:hypothetical protein